MTKAKKQVPAYRNICELLLRRIKTGELRHGDAVSSERDLAAEFGVSLMTARHALQVLTAEGILIRRPNVGTYVAPAKIHFNKLASFTEEMSARGYKPQSRVLSATLTEENDEVSSKLGLPANSSLIRLQRLRMTENEPYSIETCYFSARRYDGILAQDFEKRSLFSIISEDSRSVMPTKKSTPRRLTPRRLDC
jgi:GntR family transcriptional regulator